MEYFIFSEENVDFNAFLACLGKRVGFALECNDGATLRLSETSELFRFSAWRPTALENERADYRHVQFKPKVIMMLRLDKFRRGEGIPLFAQLARALLDCTSKEVVITFDSGELLLQRLSDPEKPAITTPDFWKAESVRVLTDTVDR